MIVTHKLSMHLDRMDRNAQVELVQNDNHCRQLQIALFAGGEVWPVPEDAQILVRYERTDGTGGEYDTLSDGSPAGSIQGNVVSVILTRKVTQEAGTVHCSLVLLRKGAQLHTFPVQLLVAPEHKPFSEDATAQWELDCLPQPMEPRVGMFLQVAAVGNGGIVTATRAAMPEALPQPTAATVGMLLEVAQVDADGKVTALAGSDRLEVLEAAVKNLQYEPIAVTAFVNDRNVAEMGDKVSQIQISWSFNKPPASITLDGQAVTGNRFTDETEYTADKTWTLTATDERGAVATKTTSLKFYNGVYYGAATDPQSANELTKVLTNTRKRTFTVNAAEGQYIFYALPVRLGACTFKVGGFEGGFDLLATTEMENSFGYSEPYHIYISANAGLGETTVEVS